MPIVIVLAPPRSGSSTVAGILHHLGVHMGTRFLEPHKNNPKGFFEDLDFIELHAAMMGHYPPGHPAFRQNKLPYTVKYTDLPDDIRDRYRSLVSARHQTHREAIWGFKDPKIPFVWSTFLIALDAAYTAEAMPPDLRIIRVKRSRAERIDSVVDMFEFELPLANQIIDLHDWAISNVCGTEYVRRSLLEIEYRELLKYPALWVTKIAAFVDVAYRQEAVDFVDPTLNHGMPTT